MRIFLIQLCVVCLAVPATAQEITGSVSGVVTDTSGAVVPNVKVTVTNTGTNVSKIVLTGPSGAYRVPFLFFGAYRVTGEREGFKTSRLDNVSLSTSEEVRVDLTMAVGQVTEVVNVAESALSLKTEEASVGTTIARARSRSFPLSAARSSASPCSLPAPTLSTTTARRNATPALSVATGFPSASTG